MSIGDFNSSVGKYREPERKESDSAGSAQREMKGKRSPERQIKTNDIAQESLSSSGETLTTATSTPIAEHTLTPRASDPKVQQQFPKATGKETPTQETAMQKAESIVRTISELQSRLDKCQAYLERPPTSTEEKVFRKELEEIINRSQELHAAFSTDPELSDLVAEIDSLNDSNLIEEIDSINDEALRLKKTAENKGYLRLESDVKETAADYDSYIEPNPKEDLSKPTSYKTWNERFMSDLGEVQTKIRMAGLNESTPTVITEYESGLTFLENTLKETPGHLQHAYLNETLNRPSVLISFLNNAKAIPSLSERAEKLESRLSPSVKEQANVRKAIEKTLEFINQDVKSFNDIAEQPLQYRTHLEKIKLETELSAKFKQLEESIQTILRMVEKDDSLESLYIDEIKSYSEELANIKAKLNSNEFVKPSLRGGFSETLAVKLGGDRSQVRFSDSVAEVSKDLRKLMKKYKETNRQVLYGNLNSNYMTAAQTRQALKPLGAAIASMSAELEARVGAPGYTRMSNELNKLKEIHKNFSLHFNSASGQETIGSRANDIAIQAYNAIDMAKKMAKAGMNTESMAQSLEAYQTIEQLEQLAKNAKTEIHRQEINIILEGVRDAFENAQVGSWWSKSKIHELTRPQEKLRSEVIAAIKYSETGLSSYIRDGGGNDGRLGHEQSQKLKKDIKTLLERMQLQFLISKNKGPTNPILADIALLKYQLGKRDRIPGNEDLPTIITEVDLTEEDKISDEDAVMKEETFIANQYAPYELVGETARLTSYEEASFRKTNESDVPKLLTKSVSVRGREQLLALKEKIIKSNNIPDKIFVKRHEAPLISAHLESLRKINARLVAYDLAEKAQRSIADTLNATSDRDPLIQERSNLRALLTEVEQQQGKGKDPLLQEIIKEINHCLENTAMVVESEIVVPTPIAAAVLTPAQSAALDNSLSIVRSNRYSASNARTQLKKFVVELVKMHAAADSNAKLAYEGLIREISEALMEPIPFVKGATSLPSRMEEATKMGEKITQLMLQAEDALNAGNTRSACSYAFEARTALRRLDTWMATVNPKKTPEQNRLATEPVRRTIYEPLLSDFEDLDHGRWIFSLDSQAPGAQASHEDIERTLSATSSLLISTAGLGIVMAPAIMADFFGEQVAGRPERDLVNSILEANSTKTMASALRSVSPDQLATILDRLEGGVLSGEIYINNPVMRMERLNAIHLIKTKLAMYAPNKNQQVEELRETSAIASAFKESWTNDSELAAILHSCKKTDELAKKPELRERVAATQLQNLSRLRELERSVKREIKYLKMDSNKARALQQAEEKLLFIQHWVQKLSAKESAYDSIVKITDEDRELIDATWEISKPVQVPDLDIAPQYISLIKKLGANAFAAAHIDVTVNEASRKSREDLLGLLVDLPKDAKIFKAIQKDPDVQKIIDKTLELSDSTVYSLTADRGEEEFELPVEQIFVPNYRRIFDLHVKTAESPEEKEEAAAFLEKLLKAAEKEPDLFKADRKLIVQAKQILPKLSFSFEKDKTDLQNGLIEMNETMGAIEALGKAYNMAVEKYEAAEQVYQRGRESLKKPAAAPKSTAHRASNNASEIAQKAKVDMIQAKKELLEAIEEGVDSNTALKELVDKYPGNSTWKGLAKESSQVVADTSKKLAALKATFVPTKKLADTAPKAQAAGKPSAEAPKAGPSQATASAPKSSSDKMLETQIQQRILDIDKALQSKDLQTLYTLTEDLSDDPTQLARVLANNPSLGNQYKTAQARADNYITDAEKPPTGTVNYKQTLKNFTAEARAQLPRPPMPKAKEASTQPTQQDVKRRSSESPMKPSEATASAPKPASAADAKRRTAEKPSTSSQVSGPAQKPIAAQAAAPLKPLLPLKESDFRPTVKMLINLEQRLATLDHETAKDAKRSIDLAKKQIQPFLMPGISLRQLQDNLKNPNIPAFEKGALIDNLCLTAMYHKDDSVRIKTLSTLDQFKGSYVVPENITHDSNIEEAFAKFHEQNRKLVQAAAIDTWLEKMKPALKSNNSTQIKEVAYALPVKGQELTDVLVQFPNLKRGFDSISQQLSTHLEHLQLLEATQEQDQKYASEQQTPANINPNLEVEVPQEANKSPVHKALKDWVDKFTANTDSIQMKVLAGELEELNLDPKLVEDALNSDPKLKVRYETAQGIIDLIKP